MIVNAKPELNLENARGRTSEIPTAIYECRVITESSDTTTGTLGGQCNTDNCSAIWSTSSDQSGSVLDMVPQCTDSD